MNVPSWLEILSIASLAAGGLCAVIIAMDLLAGHAQHMWIMNVVWPVTALYFGPVALWGYFRFGRLSSHHAMKQAREHGEEPPAKRKPFWQMCSLAATHCGSGCTLGDIVAEWTLVLFPIAVFRHKIFAGWILDYVIAFLFGIAFQYFTIQPMRHLSVKAGLAQAIKADFFSITCWQIGMYGWMALATFLIFGQEIPKATPVFWFMMQVAMWLGFATSFPVNWLLLKRGVKEKM
ncbi:MAG TPA: DUF4396 domain-containing protein [Verrucomicrobiae bacterium]|nr:DUF4396 domain-containing protein [Verrucomicrobiae bacterium]